MEATVTNWVEHLTASEVAGQIYPYVGTEWLWLTIAVIYWLAFTVSTAIGESEEQDKLARKRHGANDYKRNIAEW
tara:strand:+ start:49 stop:273 length:225 start_codon:yes stop_codon:yes gene_type:complete